MSTASIKLYDIFRKNLKIQEGEARELVEVFQDMAKDQQADKHKHIEQMVQKDIQSLKEYMDNKFATKEDLSTLRTELSRTIYFTSLGQLLAIIASVISIVLILKK
jgi:translation initiation factor 2B subunit (eIF-2B alpha/beta/delta family)